MSSALSTINCDLQKREADFARKLGEDIGLDRCYQCLTCSLGCPLTSFMDYLPHQIVRMVQCGMKEPVLNSSTIWVCASCETCVTRCPNDVDIPKLMDSLRERALKEGVKSKEQAVVNLHEVFMKNIGSYGRTHELTMIMALRRKNKNFFEDLGLWVRMGLKMIKGGKLKLRPPSGKPKSEVKEIFSKVEKR